MRVIAGTARGIRLKTPAGELTRPTADRVKEAVFSILQFELPGSRVLDLFGGTGQMGIEALSRGATSAVFVDSRREACQLIRDNIRLVKMEQQARVVQSDYLSYLQKCPDRFDLIILDPPYAEVFLENSLKCISEIDILSDRGIIICERPADKVLDLDFPGLKRGKDYQYGKTWITVFRKDPA
jgi:16S rRNA (guanine(966)-N(2))-methyltransferase RsmD